MKIKDDHYLGYFGEMFTRLYEDIGNQAHDVPADFYKYPVDLAEILKTIYRDFKMLEPIDDKPHFEITSNNKILLAFSSGKDSTATALKFLKEGYEVEAFFVQGVNRQYPQEVEYAQKVCDYIGIPLIVYKASYSGKQAYMENPIKNLYILALMLDYGLRNGFTNYSMGNHTEVNLKESNIQYNWSDAIEIYDMFTEFARKRFPQYNFISGLSEGENPYRILLESDYDMIDILGNISSCIMTNRFRESLHSKNEEKYKINLIPGRCGSCHKCAIEYIQLCRYKLIPINKAYYKACHKKLYDKLVEVFNIQPKGVSIERLYNLYGIE